MDRISPVSLKNKVCTYIFGQFTDRVCYIWESYSYYIIVVALCLAKAGLTIYVKKNTFCLKKARYLGNVVRNKTIMTDVNKIPAISNFPAPRPVKQLHRFLWMTGYQKCICNFASLAALLTDALKHTKRLSVPKRRNERFKRLYVCIS